MTTRPAELGPMCVNMFDHRFVVGMDIEGYRATTWADVPNSPYVGEKKSPWASKLSRLVCSTWYGRGQLPTVFADMQNAELRVGSEGWTALLDRTDTEIAMRWALTPENDVLTITMNGVFDMAQIVHTYRRTSPDFLKLIFQALSDGRWTDINIREKIIAVAEGWSEWEQDPLTGKRKQTQHNLAALVARHFGVILEGKEDGWRLNYHQLDGMPVREWPIGAKQYAMDDAKWSILVAFNQASTEKALPTPGGNFTPYTYETGGVHGELFQLRKAWGLFLGSIWSIRTDLRVVEQLKDEIQAAEVVIRDALSALDVLKPTKDGKISKAEGQLRQIVQADLEESGRWEPERHMTAPSAKFPDGQVSLTSEVLDDCTNPHITQYNSVKKALKLASTYLPALECGLLGPVPYSYDPLLQTGRTSSYGMSIQVMPREGIRPRSPSLVRESFVARPGYVLCSCDFTGAELAALGQNHLWAFGRSTLADTINAGIDPHAPIASVLWGVDLKTFLERLSGAHGPELKKLAKEVFRQVSKAANFGRPGGLMPRTFVAFCKGQGVDLYEIAVAAGFAEKTASRKEQDQIRLKFARHVLEAYDLAYPESPKFMEVIESFCGDGEMLRVVDDDGSMREKWVYNVEHPVSGRIRGRTPYNAACNGYFQGLVADVGSEVIWRLAVACYLPPDDAMSVFEAAQTVWPTLSSAEVHAHCAALFGCRPTIWVHDESILEGPEDTAHVWAYAQSAIMEDCGRLFIPDVRMPAKPALMRRWYKTVEEAFDENGRLIPWEPKK